MKWHGKIGYAMTTEDCGIWKDSVIEKDYKGDLTKNSVRLQTSDSVNNNLVVKDQVSVVADPFAYANFQYMKYIEIMNTMWSIESVELQYPRLLISVGGVWNGEQAESSEEI